MKEGVFEEIGRLLAELKDKSEICMYLAYSGLLYNSSNIASGSLKMEEDVDGLGLEIQKLLIDHGEDIGIDSSIALMLMIDALEMISDSSTELAQSIIEGGEPHPVLKYVDEESEEQSLLVAVDTKSIFHQSSMKELEFDDKMGIRVLGVKRGGKWTFDPEEDFTFMGGDYLLVTGYRAGIETLEEGEGAVEAWEER